MRQPWWPSEHKKTPGWKGVGFCFNYRCMKAPSRSGLYTALALLVIPFGLFIAFPMRFFIINHHFWQPILGFILFLSSFSSLMVTHLVEPGIIPPRPPPPTSWLKRKARELFEFEHQHDYINDQVELDSDSEDHTKVEMDSKQVELEVDNKAEQEVLKTFFSRHKHVPSSISDNMSVAYCYTCHTWRTPRAVHCSDCGVDVDVFDHHCPWVSNCIGKRNYRYFFIFVWMTIFFALYVSVTSVAHLVMEGSRFSNRPNPPTSPDSPPANAPRYESPFIHVLSVAPVSFGLAMFSFLMIWALIALGVYHTGLMTSGLTTSEDIKKKYPRGSPFFQGSCSKQMFFMLCGPIYPSALSKDHRYDYFEDYRYNNADMSNYPFDDDHMDVHLPNTYINPFVEGSFTLSKRVSMVDDSDEEESMEEEENTQTQQQQETDALLGSPSSYV